MYNENVNQPKNLSASEWKLLQYLATINGAFLVADVFANFEERSNIDMQNITLQFYRQFNHLKGIGYLAIIPMAPTSITSNTRPLYQLSALGHKVMQQNGVTAA
jgi:hypothetical protein